MAQSAAILILGYLVLFGTVISASSSGVMANYIPVQGSFAPSAWRNGEIMLMSAPVAVL